MRKIVGFTLVELLVVMAIMSILSIITFGQFQNAQKRARDVQRKSDLSAIYKAVFFYFTDYGKVPDVNDVSPNDIDINTLIEKTSTFTRDGYTYVNKMPSESVSGVVQYCYVGTADKKGFGVFAALESKGDSECKKYVAQNDACGNNTYNYVLLSPNVSLADLQVGSKDSSGVVRYSPAFSSTVGVCP